MVTAKRTYHRPLVVVAALVCIFLIGAITVSAQGTPITIGENKTGNVTDASSGVQYTLSVAAPQSIGVQVLAITAGFAPNFRILDPGGVVVLDSANPGTQTIAQGTPNLSSPGAYTIEVRSANATAGQFLISVQPGAPLAPPQPLTPGLPVNGAVNPQTTRQAYSFSGAANDDLLLYVRGEAQDEGLVVALRDADTDETLALSSASIGDVSYRILKGERRYLLEVTNTGGSGSQPFTVCLATVSGSAICPGSGIVPQVVPTLVPTVAPTVAIPTITFATATPTLTPTFAPALINPTGPCMVASARGVVINVRGGPGTNYNIVGSLSPNGTGLVLGRLADNSWYQASVNGVIGWVSGSVVITGGNCAVVSIVILPTVPPPAATSDVSPGLTATSQANATATQVSLNLTATAQAGGGNGNGNGGGVIHPPLSNVPLDQLLEVQPLIPRLNYSASPNYGVANLNAGFTPDPYSVGMTSGGGVNVSYLGGNCSGFATSSPDLRVSYGGGSSLLRLYFVGNGDTTMIVNDPFGNFYCVDDSFGTLNPTIDFNNPGSGSYDIWIGSYASGGFVSGTLYITRNSGNHP